MQGCWLAGGLIEQRDVVLMTNSGREISTGMCVLASAVVLRWIGDGCMDGWDLSGCWRMWRREVFRRRKKVGCCLVLGIN